MTTAENKRITQLERRLKVFEDTLKVIADAPLDTVPDDFAASCMAFTFNEIAKTALQDSKQ